MNKNFSKIPVDMMKEFVFNAGMLVTSFDTTTLEVGDIIGATSGGMSFSAKPKIIDWGEDVDNCPKNTKELADIDGWDINISGSFVTVTQDSVKSMLGAVDQTGIKFVPREYLLDSDFDDIWWVGDYSIKKDGNVTNANAGFCAVHLIDALSIDGFKIKTNDAKKGQFDFNYKAFYSIEAPDEVPVEIYLKPAAATVVNS